MRRSSSFWAWLWRSPCFSCARGNARRAPSSRCPVGALLRREGLYSSLLSEWRRQRDLAANATLKTTRRGPKRHAVDPRIQQLEREKARLERRLAQAEAIIDIQKKVSEILGIPLAKIDVDEID
jgi:transposase